MSLDELVDYFVQCARESPRKRPSLEIADNLSSLENISKEDGLRPNDILRLVDVAASGKLAASVSTRIIRSLIPAEAVPEVAVLKAISWMCTNKPSSVLQTLLVRWIILVYELLDGHEQLHALYGIVFYFLENEKMCPYVCHLLHLMTRREDVLLFRLRALINLQQRVGRQTYIIGLLSIYKLYCPQLVTMTLPRVPKSFFKQTDRAWGALIRKVQEKRVESTGQQDQASLLSRTVVSPDRMTDTTFLEPLSKRRRLQLVPSAEVCTVRAARPGARHSRIKGKPKVPITLITSFDRLLKDLDNVELPGRLGVVLQHDALQHVMSLESDPVTAYRLGYWLHHTLSQEFSHESSSTVLERQAKLLDMLVTFSEFLQESMPVWENFLTKYLHTWNGVDHRETVLKLISRIRLTQPAALNDLVLEPLRKLFFSSSVYFKCQVLWCLTRLLRNYVAVELPRYENVLEIQSANQIATGKKGSHPSFHSMFVEDVEEFDSVQTLQTLLRFVDTICVVGLPAERNHALLSHCLLDFYAVVTSLFQSWHLPLISLPHRGSFYRMLFSNNVVAVARLAELLTRYRVTYQALRDHQKTLVEGENPLYAQSLIQVKAFNSLLLDMCNVLWRDQAFSVPNELSVFALTKDPRAQSLGLSFEADAFTLRRHPALMGHTLRFLRETQPRGKRVHVSSIRFVLDDFLQFLEKQHISSIPTFINISIKRTKSVTSVSTRKVSPNQADKS